jgi:hypothetical protein
MEAIAIAAIRGAGLAAAGFGVVLSLIGVIHIFRPPPGRDPVAREGERLGKFGAAFVCVAMAALFALVTVEGVSDLIHNEPLASGLAAIFDDPFAWGLLTLTFSAFMLAASVRQTRVARQAPGWAPKNKRVCPDCAEYVQSRARFCGHRFAPRP